MLTFVLFLLFAKRRPVEAWNRSSCLRARGGGLLCSA